MKAEVRVCFYDSTQLQGWRKWGIRIMTGSYHTHVHIELVKDSSKLILLTLDGMKPRVIRLGLHKKFCGVHPYAEFSFGEFNLDYDEDYYFIENYPITYHWALIWYQIKSYFGMANPKKMPPTCTTFISDFFGQYDTKIPRFFSPKQLWRYLHDDINVRR